MITKGRNGLHGLHCIRPLFVVSMIVSSVSAALAQQHCSNQCEDLAVGQCRLSQCDDEMSAVSKSHNYKVCRTSEKKYGVYFSIFFFDSETYRENLGLSDPVKNRTTINLEALRSLLNEKDSKESRFDRRMRARVNSCLKVFEQRLCDRLGRCIALELLPPDSWDPPEVFKKYIEANARIGGVTATGELMTANDSGTFSKNIDCPTVVHEILHHAGLVDEYSEARPNFIKHQCRVMGKKNSIMRNPYNALTFNGTKFEYRWCKCIKPEPGNLKNCKIRSARSRKVLDLLYLKYPVVESIRSAYEKHITGNVRNCPAGFRMQNKINSFVGSFQGFRRFFWDQQKVANKGISDAKKEGFPRFPFLLKFEQASGVFPLTTGHIDSILYPNCFKKLKTYFQCGHLSMQHSCQKSVVESCNKIRWWETGAVLPN